MYRKSQDFRMVGILVNSATGNSTGDRFPTMDDSTVSRDELLSRLPPSPEVDRTAMLHKLIRQSGRKVIVLMDTCRVKR